MGLTASPIIAQLVIEIIEGNTLVFKIYVDERVF